LGILAAATGIPATLVTSDPDSKLEELGLDSLAAMELHAGVKSRFNVLIPEEEALAMSFTQVCAYVIERLGNA
jgi:acyl carrier protein